MRRAVRLAGMDGNPLHRGIDRVERALWVLLAVAFVVAVPMLVPLAGNVTRTENVRLLRQEQSWREVKAVLVTSAPARMDGYSSASTEWVAGSWRAPSGAHRTGLVPVTPGSPAGTHVNVWVDRQGAITNLPPLTFDAITFRVAVVEILTAIGLAMAGIGMGCAIRWVTNRRRMAYWAIEWACFGPRWSAKH
jgi:hypothetical protein